VRPAGPYRCVCTLASTSFAALEVGYPRKLRNGHFRRLADKPAKWIRRNYAVDRSLGGSDGYRRCGNGSVLESKFIVCLRSGVTAQGQSQTRDALGKDQFPDTEEPRYSRSCRSQPGGAHQRFAAGPLVSARCARRCRGRCLLHLYDRLHQGKRPFACAVRFS